MREYNLQNLGFKLNFIYKEENIDKDKNTPETNKIRKFELLTLIYLFRNFPNGFKFETLLKIWNKHVPDDYASLREQLNFIHFDDEILFKVKNIYEGYELQQIAKL